MTSEEIEDASWQCNGSDIFKDGCYSGQKSFDLHLRTRAWRCVEQQEGEQDDSQSGGDDGQDAADEMLAGHDREEDEDQTL